MLVFFGSPDPEVRSATAIRDHARTPSDRRHSDASKRSSLLERVLTG